jgi:hypothetical protein
MQASPAPQSRHDRSGQTFDDLLLGAFQTRECQREAEVKRVVEGVKARRIRRKAS